MSAMQSFSKAMFTPVLILPIAGILIAVGNIFTNARLMEVLPFLNNPVTTGFGSILSGSLVSILNNLGLIFKGRSRLYFSARVFGLHQRNE